MSILVTYATAKGATSEVAEAVALRLKAFATTVDLLPIKDVSTASLPKYSAIIVGSAIHMGSWLGPAKHFIQNNSTALNSKQVWAFSVGMPPKEDARKEEESIIDKKIRKDLPGLRGHKLFLGRFEKTDLPWVGRIVITCCIPKDKQKWGDFRNWEEIHAWADSVGREMVDG
jgi:menaquinone-dependent protoporphyrinogen oxidase